MAPFTPKPKILGLLGMLLPLAACGTTDRIKASSIPLDDYRARHPIVLAQAKTSIDVFPSMEHGRLDRRTAKQIFAFAKDYREVGRGGVIVLLPRGPNASGADHGLVSDIRRYLAAGGAGDRLEVSTYPVADPRLASPVRLSFVGLKAEVADQCGQWPRDLASGSSIDGWDNKPYWNFGCATQTMIAAQAADPRDLVTPRGEDAADTLVRDRGIDAIRQGRDPNTGWQVRNSNIGGIGGSN